jgi:hypothetical protein
MAELPEKAPTHLVKTVSGIKRYILYYDPDIFKDKVILSASLMLDGEKYHYNNIFEEPEEAVDLEAVSIYPQPQSTLIDGSKKVEVNAEQSYTIGAGYDPEGVYNYQWSVEGNASITGMNGRTLTVAFGEKGKATLTCYITNPAGCGRTVTKNVYIGTAPNKLLIVRNNYI